MIKKFILGILTLATTTISAQRNSASPYSYFGIGENFEQSTVEQSSMGSIGVAMKDNYHLNFINPAANADLRVTNYAIGGSLSFLTLKELNNSASSSSTNLRYVALGLPIGKKMGFTVGLQPYSSVGYVLINKNYSGDDLIEISRFSGSGGTNRLYAGFGTYISKGFSLGVEASFIFGSIERNNFNQNNNISLGTKHREKLNIRGGQFKFGAQYQTELKNKLNFNSGASVILENDLTVTGSEKLYSLTISGSGIEKLGSVLYNKSVSGIITMPYRVVYGVGLGKADKWYIGINQELKKAISTSGDIGDPSDYQYESGRKFSIGGYYIPKMNSISSYWDRVTYRAGVRFEKLGLLLDGQGSGQNLTPIDDFGINFGVGLPLPKLLSNVNLGFEYGQRGTISNNLVKENYFNVKLSLSLNSLNWFAKRKID